jgi:hypothetical protein
MSRAVLVAIAGVFLAAGAGLLVAAVRRSAARRAFLAASAPAEGRVVGFREAREGERPSYFPCVEFRTASGAVARFESELGSEQPTLAVGDAVRVRYRLDAPNEAEIASIWALWGLAALLGTLGAVFALLGAALLLGWIRP